MNKKRLKKIGAIAGITFALLTVVLIVHLYRVTNKKVVYPFILYVTIMPE